MALARARTPQQVHWQARTGAALSQLGSQLAAAAMPRITMADVGLALVAFFLPPLAVFIKKNACDGDVLLNCLLTLLGWIPGVIHAAYILLEY